MAGLFGRVEQLEYIYEKLNIFIFEEKGQKSAPPFLWPESGFFLMLPGLEIKIAGISRIHYTGMLKL